MIFDKTSPFERLHEISKAAGLECSAKTWLGSRARYELRCTKGHVFTRNGTFLVWYGIKACPICADVDRIKNLRQLANDAGLRCLDEEWRGVKASYHFKCTHGHEFKRTAARARANMRCLTCVRGQHSAKILLHDGLQRLKDVAQRHGGKCLADLYAGGHLRYAFRCAIGHQWEAEGSDVLRGSWCMPCSLHERSISYRLTDGMQKLQKLALEKGGKCLSDTYLGGNATYRFICGEGHEWATRGSLVMRGSWCRLCRNDAKRLTLTDAHEAALARNGQCISESYINNNTRLSWLCERGHAWAAPLARIRQGHWCHQCASMARIHKPNSKAWMKYQSR